MRDGELSRAMTALTSEPLAPNDDTTYQKLQAKHPSRLLGPSPITTPSLDIKPITATEEDIITALSSFHRGSSGGALGLRPEHLQVAVQFHHDARTDPLGTLTKLISHMLAGKVPLEVFFFFFLDAWRLQRSGYKFIECLLVLLSLVRRRFRNYLSRLFFFWGPFCLDAIKQYNAGKMHMRD